STHTVADGAYVALAEGLGVPLITCDGRLAQSHGHNAEIELVA
ncbi:VapC toxin family PIN domain ribonuclease, partial [Escherichia coli]|nr:VapC toxin family PIN domain ribonuclease [Escherichia coli]